MLVSNSLLKDSFANCNRCISQHLQCAPTWDVSSHGLLLITSSCAHAMDPNTPPMVTWFVDLLPFLSLLPIVMLPKMARFSSPHGLRMISAPEVRDGGTKRNGCYTYHGPSRVSLVACKIQLVLLFNRVGVCVFYLLI